MGIFAIHQQRTCDADRHLHRADHILAVPFNDALDIDGKNADIIEFYSRFGLNEPAPYPYCVNSGYLFFQLVEFQRPILEPVSDCSLRVGILHRPAVRACWLAPGIISHE
jgi:hypothetical protein